MNDILEKRVSISTDVERRVLKIINDVKKKGDYGLRLWTKKLDGADIQDFSVSENEIKRCLLEIPDTDRKMIKTVITRVEKYHRKQFINQFSIKEPGIKIDFKVKPVEKVGIYIPAGRSPLVSTVIMTAVPAKVAGVKEIIACSPPSYFGTIHPYIIATLAMLEIKKIFKVGGSQAIAAMAFGTESIPKVNIIAGPGNIFVNTAKKLLTGTVGIDLLAGPSELVVLMDNTANPDWVEADLKSQQEHRDGFILMVSTDELLAKKIAKKIKTGYWIKVESIEKGVNIVNKIAPEHVQVICKNARKIAEKIIAGAIFIGNYTPCALGDYIAGPSHTLPTCSSACFDSGLSVFNFLRTFATIEANKRFFYKNGIIAERIAEIENLVHHKKSLKERRVFS
ncbi:MAG: histidinol dehydrogenase [Candidatus Omnitrophica bacterium]|nr:histidinol dehydrogenase [Candidatus Omnitrophota bacterium]